MEQTFSSLAAVRPPLSPVGDLLSRAWQIYQEKFKKFLEIYWCGLAGLAPFLLVLILMSLVNVLAAAGSLKLALNVILGILAGVTFFIFVYYAVRTQIGLMLYFERSQAAPARAVFIETKNYFWRFLGVTLLTVLFILLWTLLLIVPGIIFSIYYTFASLVLLFEGRPGRAALKRSQQLVKGYWWAVLGRLIFLGLIYFVITMVLSLPNLFWVANSVYGTLWRYLVQAINFLIGPLFGVYSYLIYKNLVDVKGQS